MIRRIPYHAPISSTRSANGRLACATILKASSRISAILFNRANKGANGKAATNRVTNPYWRTENFEWIFFSSKCGLKNRWESYSFLDIHRIVLNVLDPAYDNPVPKPYVNVFHLLFVSCVFAGATNSRIFCELNYILIKNHGNHIKWHTEISIP